MLTPIYYLLRIFRLRKIVLLVWLLAFETICVLMKSHEESYEKIIINNYYILHKYKIIYHTHFIKNL
jgi:hypothetical protein